MALREAVEVIRKLLAGETVTYKGSRRAGRRRAPGLQAGARADVPMYIASQRAVGVPRRRAGWPTGPSCRAAWPSRCSTFFRDTVAAGAREAGRDPGAIDLVARINVCVDDDRQAARDLMKPTIVRSLAAQRPDFFTFTTAGLTVPPALAKHLEGLTYAYDPRAVPGGGRRRAGRPSSTR